MSALCSSILDLFKICVLSNPLPSGLIPSDTISDTIISHIPAGQPLLLHSHLVTLYTNYAQPASDG